MAEISFNPSFHDFLDYVDGQDLVRAEGQGGLNAWLAAIESDLAQLSTVVTAIDARLDQLETRPPTTRRIVVPQDFLRVSEGPGPWRQTIAGSEMAFFGSGTDGLIDLLLPGDVQLVSLRAIGHAVGVSVVISLFQTPVGGGESQTLATATGTTDPFDITIEIGGTLGKVDTGAFAYRIRATIAAGAANPVTGAITGLQLTVTG
jgi:hypothetical protein